LQDLANILQDLDKILARSWHDHSKILERSLYDCHLGPQWNCLHESHFTVALGIYILGHIVTLTWALSASDLPLISKIAWH
jgi:hypothetical protein